MDNQNKWVQVEYKFTKVKYMYITKREHDDLLRIVEGTLKSHGGLCRHVNLIRIYEVVWLWPKFSRDVIYPVPGGQAAYYKAAMRPRLSFAFYDTNTQYGRDRIELAQFILDNTKIKEEQ